ncbi:MAG: hypothetical protein RBU37_13940 [Myxococcota bacterium]|jgi:hypothetical protein|nr:hypothetical protein [Myxococcota bacterium]
MLSRISPFLLVASLVVGCHGLENWDSQFDYVDENFTRPSPTTVVQSALQQACSQPTVLLQSERDAFGHALCLCGNISNVGDGLMTSSKSYLLGSDQGKGHVGINGRVEVVGDFVVGGVLEAGQGLSGVGDLRVSDSLLSGSDVSMTGDWEVGGDAWIDGDLDAVGSFRIGRGLYLSGDFSAVGQVSYQTGHLGFTYGGPPCPCNPSQLVDVAAEVAAHASDNDNARLPTGIGEQALILDAGSYYFSQGSEVVGASSITIRDHVKMYVQGDLESVGSLDLIVEPNAELELWVAGKLSTVGNLNFADASDGRPRAFRLFMGGSGASVVNVGNASFVGAIYAPEVDIEYVGSLRVEGSLFARSIDGTGTLEIVYDTDLATSQDCADEGYKL